MMSEYTVPDETLRIFLQTTRDSLTAHGYKLKKEAVKSGVRYTFPDGGFGAVVKLTVSPQSVSAHILGRHIMDYIGFIQTLPKPMLAQIRDGYPCKRSADPNACKPSCAGGFRFSLDGADYMKCVNFNFKFEATDENIGTLSDFIERERIQREESHDRD